MYECQLGITSLQSRTTGDAWRSSSAVRSLHSVHHVVTWIETCWTRIGSGSRSQEVGPCMIACVRPSIDSECQRRNQ